MQNAERHWEREAGGRVVAENTRERAYHAASLVRGGVTYDAIRRRFPRRAAKSKEAVGGGLPQ